MCTVCEIRLAVMAENADALAWLPQEGFQFAHVEPLTMGATKVTQLIGLKKY